MSRTDPDFRAVGALIRWYAREGHDLPWRRTRDRWAVLVSEVMLQSTQVARVVPYYEAWMTRWPTAADLAAAPLGEVLAQWQGLGYPRRARNLHAALQEARDGVDDREVISLRDTAGTLQGICPDCNRMIYRRVNPQKLDAVRGDLDVTVSQAASRIEETANPNVNCDSTGGSRQ